MKIQTKISIIIFFLILITGVVTTTSSYIISEQMLETEIHHHLESIATSKAQHVETVLNNNIKRVVKTLATSKFFQDIFTKRNIKQAKQKIKNLIDIYDEISRIRILDKYGRVVVSSHSKIDYIGNIEIFANGKKESYIRDVHISNITGTKVISISAPILIKGKFAGIVIVNVEIETELYEVTLHRHGESGEVYIINKDGYMITPSRFIDNTFLKLKVNSSEAKKCLAITTTEHNVKYNEINRYQDYRGKPVLGTYRYIQSLNWCLLAEIDVEEAYAPVNKLVQLIAILLIVLLIISGILTFFSAKNITRPILKLHRRAEEIEQGNWNYQVTVDSQDEIGQFSRAFDSMTTRFKNAQDELQNYQQHLEKLVEERTAELTITNEQLKQEIEERTQISNTLCDTKEQVSLLLNSTSEAIFGMDITGCCTFCNPACVNILGYNSVDKLLGQDIHSMIHHSKSDGSPINKKNCLFYQSIKQKKEVHSDSEILWRADNTPFPTECWSHPILREGEIIGAVVTFIDITERKQAEQALAKSNALLTAVIEQAPFAIQICEGTTDNWEIITTNKEAQRITGATEEQQRGLGISHGEVVYPEKLTWQMLYPDGSSWLPQDVPLSIAMSQGKVTKNVEMIIRRADGIKHTILCNATPILNDKKEIIAGIIIYPDITERKQIELALQESEKQFREYFESALVGFTVTSLEKDWIYANNCICNLLGYSLQELQKLTWPELTHPDDLAADVVKFEQLLVGEIDSYTMDKRFIHKNSSVVYTFVSVTAHCQKNGEIDYIVATLQDITERKQAEFALQKSEEKHRRLIENMSDEFFFYSHDTNGVFTFLSNSIQNTLGYTPTEFMTHYTEYLTDSPINERVQYHSEQSVQGIVQPLYELEIYCKDRTIKSLEVSETPVFNEQGNVIAVEGIAHDVTERKQAEATLQKERNKLLTILNAIPYGVYIISKQFDIEYANPVLLEEFGSLDGRKCYSYFHGRNEICPWCKNKQVFAGESVEWEFYVSQHGKYFKLFDTPIQNADGTISKFEIFHDITKRKLAEKALQESEQKYREILERLNDAAYRMSLPDGKYDYFAPSTLNVFGYKAEEWINNPLFIKNIIHPDFVDYFNEKWTELIQGKLSKAYEYKIIDPEGNDRWICQSNTGTYDEHNNLIAIEGLCRNITEQKLAEIALLEHAKRQKALLDSIPAYVYFKDRQSNYLAVNKAFAKILNIDVEDFVGKTDYDFFPTKDAENYRNYDLQVMKSGKPVYNLEESFVDSNGQQSYVLTTKVPYRNAQGTVIGLVGTTLDITERKLMEEKLIQSEQRYRRLFTENKAIELLIDPTNGKIVDFNKAAIKYYGYSATKLKSMRISDINTLSKEEIVAEMNNADIEQRDCFTFKHRLASGEIRDVEVYSGPIELDGQHLLYSVVHDTTAWKIAEAKLEQAKEEADSANRAKSEFLANMSHEIRTPMNAVIGFSDILTAEITDKKQKNHLNSIQTAGKSLLTLINDILDLSKIEAGRLNIQYEQINPHLIFSELQQIFNLKIAEKNLEFIMEIDENLPTALYLDETRLRQILMNLVGNAIKFTDNGYIKLCVKKICTEGNYIDLLFAVEDSGIGVPNTQQTLIFESFRQQDGQSNRQYGGTGLGLAISKHLVEMMNGQICVKNNHNRGSRFEIILWGVEITKITQEIKQTNVFDIKNIMFEKVQILVVDDIESNRNLIVEYLSPINLEVICAENGQQALLFAKEYLPALILMDIRMPEMDGYEATKQLKGNPKTADIPIIALTASVVLDDRDKIKEHNFDGYLSKPVNISILLNQLTKYLKYTTENITNDIEVDEKFSLDNVVNCPVLQDKITQEIVPLWEEANMGIEQEIVVKLANKLIELGNEHDVPIFISHGELLQEYIQAFDITNTLELLKELSEILKL
ncbi:PAS domain S-box protein [Candidatus Halobeggiatoa sp. HSG11]|nr:PAS domain S-box protein [Candidatus Halobeggiatoa sp. HSG11]